jgi:Na+-driven multidrug efflux pump
MIAQVICTALHFAWCYIFIIKYDMKGYGSGIAMSLTYIIEFITVIILANNVPRIKKVLFWPTKESFNDWAEYFAISVPATVMICASWWGYEFAVVAASYLGVN